MQQKCPTKDQKNAFQNVRALKCPPCSAERYRTLINPAARDDATTDRGICYVYFSICPSAYCLAKRPNLTIQVVCSSQPRAHARSSPIPNIPAKCDGISKQASKEFLLFIKERKNTQCTTISQVQYNNHTYAWMQIYEQRGTPKKLENF